MSYRTRQLILLIGDLLAMYCGLFLTLTVRYWHLPNQSLNNLLHPMTWLYLGALIIIFIAGAYDITRTKNTWGFFQRIVISASAWVILGAIFFYIHPRTYVTPKTILALNAFFGFGLVALWRYFYNKFLSNVIPQTNVIFAGLTDESLELIEAIKRSPQIGFKVLGLVEPNAGNSLLYKLKDVEVYHSLAEFKKSEKGNFQLIIIAPTLTNDTNLLKELYHDLFKQVEILDLVKFYENIMGRIPPATFSEAWFLSNLHEQHKKTYDRLRIFIDYAVAAILAVLFAISFPFIALAIKLTSQGPIFYRQERVGRNGKNFIIYKYRTMKALTDNGSAEIDGPKWADYKDSRVTKIGKLLRKARIDELPQFLNILHGDMSLIGPRPERPEFIAQLKEKMPFYDLRHIVKPGLTGWAQLHNAYYGTVEENLKKLEYDLYYIKNRSAVLDGVIILKTVKVLLRMMGR